MRPAKVSIGLDVPGSVAAAALALVGVLGCGGPTSTATVGETSESNSGPETSGSSSGGETSESSSGSETDTGSPPVPADDDPEAPPGCWELVAEVGGIAVSGVDLAQFLATTFNGVLRVEADTNTVLGEGLFDSLWASDLDNGWLSGPETGLVRLVDGGLEPWPEPPGFVVAALVGRGPDDVWASGEGLAHFDGASWTELDLEAVFGFDGGGHPSNLLRRAALTENWAYFSASETILAWDGASGSIIPPPPELLVTAKLFGFEGDELVLWDRWCDFGCIESMESWDGASWTSRPALVPSYADGWQADAQAIDGPSDTNLWALSRDLDSRIRAGHFDGASWRRVRVPGESAGGIHGLADGAVLTRDDAIYRGATACLFDEG